MRNQLSTSTQKNSSLAIALKSRFGLTGAETEIALALAGGADIVRTAQLREVAHHTVRSQLKAIFRKTGARSQAQLVAIVLKF